MFVIVTYPRLKVHFSKGVPHLGMMHLLATNIIVWIRVVLAESLHAFVETGGVNETLIPHALERFHCKEHFEEDSPILYKICYKVDHISHYIYSFIIEFSVTGAIFYYTTWDQVHNMSMEQANYEIKRASIVPIGKKNSLNGVKKRHNLLRPLAKANWSQSRGGIIGGFIVLAIAVINLFIFLAAVDVEDKNVRRDLEGAGQVVASLINCLAIGTCISGIVQANTLADKTNKSHDDSYRLDKFLLNFGGFFIYIYNIFVIIAGTLSDQQELWTTHVHWVHGILEIVAVSLQSMLIYLLLMKVNWIFAFQTFFFTLFTIQDTESAGGKYPGRQNVAILSFINFSLWIYNTFQLPRSALLGVEAEFYGEQTWIWLERISLPVCIFFRWETMSSSM